MSTGNVSRPAEPQRPAQTPHQGKASNEKPADTDLFASLLSLVSDTHFAPDATDPLAEPIAADAAAQDPRDQNPLAALLAWTAPAAVAATATTTTSPSTPVATAPAIPAPAQPGVADPALPQADAPLAGGVDISGMTAVMDEKLAIAPETTAPANPARPAFATPATRPAFASRAEAPAASGAPAMVWQRGAASSTDALQQQFASQSIQQPQNAPLAHVRSTVALDERFALANAAALQANASRDTGLEPALPGSAGPRVASSQDALSGVGGSPMGGHAGATGEGMGGSSGDGLPGDQAGSAPDGTPMNRETEGPTVSHWGTQHLRHASLRVGESGADAIDIQLSMKGQEVQVAFQSDNAEARASLREGASEALSDLLQRSGIQLGHVSVGSQGQQNGQPTQHTPTVHRGEALGKPDSTLEAPPSPRPPRADGSRPLDLFV